jgi:hypothetical protein
MLRRGMAAAADAAAATSAAATAAAFAPSARRAAHAYAFPPPAVTALPVDGSDALFPVRRVFCVGRNYAAVRVRARVLRGVSGVSVAA